MKADFHCHTQLSDGALSPEALLARAHAQGVTHLAITDHDTTRGYEQALPHAQSHAICLVSGVEASCQWRGNTIHVVGLGIDVSDPGLQQGLKWNRALRWQRAISINERFKAKKQWDLLSSILPDIHQGMIGRNHFAQALIAQGHVKTQKQAFDRYLKKGQPMFVDIEWPSLSQVVAWIVRAGGMAVLAHPHQYGLTSNKMNQMLTEFTQAGGLGIEVVNQPRVCSEQFAMAKRAQDFGLYASLGSDFHTPDQTWRNLGWLSPLPAKTQSVWHWLSKQPQ